MAKNKMLETVSSSFKSYYLSLSKILSLMQLALTIMCRDQHEIVNMVTNLALVLRDRRFSLSHGTFLGAKRCWKTLYRRVHLVGDRLAVFLASEALLRLG